MMMLYISTVTPQFVFPMNEPLWANNPMNACSNDAASIETNLNEDMSILDPLNDLEGRANIIF